MDKPRLRAAKEVTGFALGQVPGTPVYTGPERDFPVRMHGWTWTREKVDSFEVHPTAGAGIPSQRPLWVDVVGIHDVQTIIDLSRAFSVHPLTVEDITSAGQRVKIEPNDGYLHFVVRMYEARTGEAEQLSLVLGEDYLLTFQQLEGDNFETIRGRLRDGVGRLRRKGPAYLAYALLDAVVDGYASVQKSLEEAVTELEDVLDEGGDAQGDFPEKVHHLKRSLVALRRAAAPLRDEVSRLLRDENPLVPKDVLPFFRDLHDHLIYVVEATDTYRENTRSLMELHLSNASQKMNEDMRLLTVVATIFIPLTFLAGVYGMNFEHMPELSWPWAYPLFWLASILIALGLGLFFKRRDWL